LAELHLAGAGGTRDAPRAVELLKEASEAGDGFAKTQLALIYLEGRDVFKDSRKAEQLLQDAAGSGHVAASLQLGHLYAGHYDPARAQPDDALGHYLVAAQAGNAIAQHLVASQLLSRNDPAAAKEGVQWLHRAARSGFPPALFQMGVLFCQGQVVAKDLAEGVRWYERAAQQGHALALYNLGVMAMKGLGVEADVEKGKEMIKRAEAQGALGAAKAPDADKPEPGRTPPEKNRPTLGVVKTAG
jgi:TPR repeat protein